MRLFVAVEPPSTVERELEDVIGALRGSHATATPEQPEPTPSQALRWTRREQWHITLAFLGEVQPDALSRLRTRLARAAARHRPMVVRLARGGRFDGSTLWTGVSGDRDRLRALAWSVQAAARRSGIAVDERPFRPHLTLARASRRIDLRPWVADLAGWESSAWTVHEIAVVRSRLGPPTDYEVVQRFALR